MLPNRLKATTEELRQIAGTFSGEQWVGDEGIRLVHQSLTQPNGSPLPENIYFMTPCEALHVVSDVDPTEHVQAVAVHTRHLVFVPINDAAVDEQELRYNDGKHWSLLLIYRVAGNSSSVTFCCKHIDSLALCSHKARAQNIARALVPGGLQVELLPCSKQMNSYDCGIYVLHHSELILRAFLSFPSWRTFAFSRSWPQSLLQVSPGAIKKYRQALFDRSFLSGPPERSSSDWCERCGFFLLGDGSCLNPLCGAVAQSSSVPTGIASNEMPSRDAPRALAAMRKKTASVKVGKPAAAPRRGSSFPRPWSPRYAYTTSGDVLAHSRGNNFRSLDQPSYPEVVGCTEEQATVSLHEFGLLPHCIPRVGRFCWKCKKPLQMKTKKDGRKLMVCDWKCAVALTSTAYTPMYCAEVTRKQYWMVAWCFANQHRLDQTIHLSGLKEFTVARLFACHRDVCGWWVIHSGRDLQLRAGEVDIDVAKSAVSRNDPHVNKHRGRLLVLKERSTKRRKFVTCPDVTCPKGEVPGPESLEDVSEPIQSTLRPGSIACADGGQAIKSAVRKTAKGAIPLAYATHGMEWKKQFTALQKIPREGASQELIDTMNKMGRLEEGSSSIRVTGGNQGAEGVWGSMKSLQKGMCTHRGGAVKRATAHAACAAFIAHNPGVRKLGHAWTAWYALHLDSTDPKGFFTRSGWTGKGPFSADPNAPNIPLSKSLQISCSFCFDYNETIGFMCKKTCKQITG